MVKVPSEPGSYFEWIMESDLRKYLDFRKLEEDTRQRIIDLYRAGARVHPSSNLLLRQPVVFVEADLFVVAKEDDELRRADEHEYSAEELDKLEKGYESADEKAFYSFHTLLHAVTDNDFAWTSDREAGYYELLRRMKAARLSSIDRFWRRLSLSVFAGLREHRRILRKTHQISSYSELFGQYWQALLKLGWVRMYLFAVTHGLPMAFPTNAARFLITRYAK